MSVLSQFFDRTGRSPEGALSLQVLFARPPSFDPAALTRALRSASPELADAVVELDAGLAAKGHTRGVVRWGGQVVRFVGFGVAMPAPVVEHCVAPAHYGQELKAQARAHRAHLLLYHDDARLPPLERYVALAAVAGALGQAGGVVVLNESAHTSFPAAALAPGAVEGDQLQTLRDLPLLILYCGFVKGQVPDQPGVWMRTYGCHLFELPDLAMHTAGHHQGQETFDLFGNLLGYLQKSGARFGVGHTMQVGPDTYLRLRGARPEEEFLHSEGELFVAERIGADQINRPRG
jgi:hypothetical protein